MYDMFVHDVRGRPFAVQPYRRIVSLVPSLTETLFDFGMGEHVVGRTDYCIHPAEALPVESIGGTKNPDIDAVARLQPELVFADIDENRKQDVDALEQLGIRVFVTHPQSVAEAMALLGTIFALLAPLLSRNSAEALIHGIRKRYNELRSVLHAHRPRVFVPIWMDPWMTFSAGTYADDLLALLGLENVFRDRCRRKSLHEDLSFPSQTESLSESPDAQRYPRLSTEEILAADPEVLLLPSEPYPFAQENSARVLSLLSETTAVKSGRVYVVEGSLLFWWGTRMRLALSNENWAFFAQTH